MCVCVLAAQTGQLEPLLNKFTAEEERQMKRMLQRVDILANVSIAQHRDPPACVLWRTIDLLT